MKALTMIVLVIVTLYALTYGANMLMGRTKKAIWPLLIIILAIVCAGYISQLQTTNEKLQQQLPIEKEVIIEVPNETAYQNGYAEGYKKGIEDGELDAILNANLIEYNESGYAIDFNGQIHEYDWDW